MTPRQAAKLTTGDMIAPKDDHDAYEIVVSNFPKEKVVQFLSRGCLEWKEMAGWAVVKVRKHFTGAELEQIPLITAEFGKELAAIAAKQLRKFPPQSRDYLMIVLQDATSLYSPYVADRIDELVRRKVSK